MNEKMDLILYMIENGYEGNLEGLTQGCGGLLRRGSDRLSGRSRPAKKSLKKSVDNRPKM